MKNPLVEKVEQELEKLGFHGAELIRESYHEEHFGNAQAVYKMGNLCLDFLRERGDDTVDFLNPDDNKQLYTFSDMSLFMNWTTLDVLIKKYKRTDFTEPPSGPIPLREALGLVKKHFEQLQEMYSPAQIDATLESLKGVSTKRCKAFFG